MLTVSSSKKNYRVEFGDFQTPYSLAVESCNRLIKQGVSPDIIIEPSCGVGAFVLAAAQCFDKALEIHGIEINPDHLAILREKTKNSVGAEKIHLEQADFFNVEWEKKLQSINGPLLVLGNFPWVTNSAQGAIGGENLPIKSNFQNHTGFDSISGKANFDISEWMLLQTLTWFKGRKGHIAMLAKTAVARKILSHARQQGVYVEDAAIICIDAKKEFSASVDACLLVIHISDSPVNTHHDYTIYSDLNDFTGRQVGHRMGQMVGDLALFETRMSLLGQSPQKWRSGIKHDAASVMELTLTEMGLENGFGERVDIEKTYIYPLYKGSDIGSGKPWRRKYVICTQVKVGTPTRYIEEAAPLTWDYLLKHAEHLDSRRSSIYAKNPRFSVFGVGEYAFRPWKIAICGLYKKLSFRLIGPIDERPVLFDDTVYYLSFDSENEAGEIFQKLNSEPATEFLSSLIFWDEKRPIKTAILNLLDWRKLAPLDQSLQHLKRE